MKRLTTLLLLALLLGRNVIAQTKPQSRVLTKEQQTAQAEATRVGKPPSPTPIVAQKDCTSEAFKNDPECKPAENKENTVTISKLTTANVSIQRNAERDVADWIAYVFGVALSIAGIAGVCFAYRTLRAIEGQLTEMRTQRETMQGQLVAMNGQIDQMKASGAQTDQLIEHASSQVALMASAGTHTETLAAQAVKQSELTQRQFDLANRPWISIEFLRPISPVEFRDSGDLLVWFGYRIKNAGNSVAQHIQPWIEPIINGVTSPVEVRTRISDQLKRPIDSPFDHGRLIFPNQIIEDRYVVMIRPDDLVNALDKSPFKNPDGSTIRGIGLEIFVCFDYQSTVDSSKHYQTQSMYLLSHRGMGLFRPEQKSYGVDGLGLIFKGFGAYAD